MPPKRKRGGSSSRGRGGKKAKTSNSDDEPESLPAPAKTRRGRKAKQDAVTDEPEPIDEPEPEAKPSTTKEIIEKLKKSDNKQCKAKVDQYCRLANSGSSVLDDYDCMLNQTNIGHNNNKYYVIQVIEHQGRYYSWNRWGRVGEPGQNSLKGPMLMENAIKDFEKKFQDKTKNKWDKRDEFMAVAGKYTLIEMGQEDDEEEQTVVKVEDSSKVKLPCALDKPTQDLVKMIFDNDMFQEAMKNLEIDVKKMPLGKISKNQIAKGFEALDKLEEALNNNQGHLLTQLSSQFYTLIPHNFGRQRPPTISDAEMLQKKKDLLTVLGDIEVAQAMQKEEQTDKQATAKTEPHPLDSKYGLLQCDLKHVEPNSKNYKIINTYLTETKDRNLQILDVWEVNRHSEGQRFAVNDKIENRKLLWHGTNVAVVVAILKGGLRIMPHSGGRVGKGVYFASENGKSASYVSPTGNNIGIMFLNEVALGKEHHISQDDNTLVTAPKGYDSIVAKGRTEPDPKKDTEIVLDGHKVIVPQGKPIPQPQFSNSYFSQSEYLIYREDQCRIRYILKLKF